MNKSFNWQSAFAGPRAIIILVLAAACSFTSATLLGFLHPKAPTTAAGRTLTFEQRVSYQRAIEEVYWQHRIWPKERRDSKPPLETVTSSRQIEKKVRDYLRNSRVLEDYWQQPISSQQLQAEMERMAQHTKQPEVLRELFEALGNNPFVIAECLARPALAERLLKKSYAYDQRIHGQLKEQAESDLRAHPRVEQMKQTSGTYNEINLVRSGSSQDERQHGTELNNREWDETVQKLAATYNKNTTAEDYQSIPVGQLSASQEDETRYYASAVTEKAEDHFKVATVTWSKELIESWRVRAEKQAPATIAPTFADYTLPTISSGTGGCVSDTWAASSLNTLTPRDAHTAIWTGSEMIIWGGGFGYPFTPTNTGGRYNPSTDTWTPTNTLNAPSARGGHSAVWTGNEMIVWGGGWVNTGGRYNPSTDSWIPTSKSNAPSGRSGHSAVWTGTEMIVWGGNDSTGELNTGGRYNPSANSWTGITTTNAPTARAWHSTIWTGSQMIVWGGHVDNNINQTLSTGGRYNPATNSWTATSTTNAPSARENHTAVWTGSRMIVWGGINFNDPSNSGALNTGGEYDPATNSWMPTNTTNAPAGRYYQTATWTGNEMIVWGGETAAGYVNTGSKYFPSTDSWSPITATNAPPERWRHSAVWSGSEMIVWGGDGSSGSGALNTGGRYNPSTDTWAPGGAPSGRTYHTMVWTGSEVIVWGGFNGYFDLNTGGKYNPATDSWINTSTVNAPPGRYFHTAVWTGNEMIVWGGFDGNCSVNSGGKYNPDTDSWMPTSTANAPVDRSYSTAVWTGAEMIVWGGYDCDANVFNTGGKYDPSADTWVATSTINAPTPRSHHTAVWTGSEMVIWGGSPEAPFQSALNTGGRYDPASDSWASTTLTNAPSARLGHTATWTGSEMIVWGGASDANYHQAFDNSYLLNTGARYSPATDSWAATSVTNAPTVRGGQTAIWTGSEMIVWGGGDNGPAFALNTGGRYIPTTDSWTSTSTTNNTPIGRSGHTAAWTGNEMIVWGGLNAGFLNGGGRYCGEAAPTPAPTATPTPSTTPAQTVATPVLSPSGGTFNKKVKVKISCATAGATIYYTLDGNDPTTASAIYPTNKKFKGIKLKGQGLHTIKVMAAASGFNNSTIASATFTIN